LAAGLATDLGPAEGAVGESEDPADFEEARPRGLDTREDTSD
jgi:hypothetical protein